jgi:hypothetical protein
MVCEDPVVEAGAARGIAHLHLKDSALQQNLPREVPFFPVDVLRSTAGFRW